MADKASLALDRTGFVTGFKVKPRKMNAKNEVAFPSTVVLTIETDNDSQMLALLGKIQRDGASINFGIEPAQVELDFGGAE